MSHDADEFEGVETYRLPGREAAPDAPARRWLVVVAGAPPRVLSLAPDTSLTIGRSPGCELAIADRAISRRHAILHVGPSIEIEDLESANGLLVAGNRVPAGARVPVPVGSAIQLGNALLVVHGGSNPPSLDAEREAPPARPLAPDESAYVVLDPAMQRAHELVARVASTRLNVLLLGETGAGKEVLAEALHRRSPRAAAPFVKLNCAAISPQLLESELFGHERGAFTGAHRARQGLLEAADGGTLLLDEIGEMPPALQVKLLRVIEELRVTRVGAVASRSVDVRFVAATHRDLPAEIRRGAFRQDLYYRLNGISVQIPPLRARPSEIVPLAKHFLAMSAGGAAPPLDDAFSAALLRHPWPGNVRELRNVMERALALSGGESLRLEHLPPELFAASQTTPAAPAGGDLREDLAALEKQRIVEALERCGGNQTQAASLLGMPRRTLISRIAEYGLPRPRKGRRG